MVTKIYNLGGEQNKFINFKNKIFSTAMLHTRYKSERGYLIKIASLVYKSRIGGYSRNSIKQDLSALIPL